MTSFSDHLDRLASVTSDLLASESITVHRNAPKGAMNYSTRTRAVDIGALEETVAAIGSSRIQQGEFSKRTTYTHWTINADAITFIPASTCHVVDGDGKKWLIQRVEPLLDGKQYKLHCVSDS